MRFLLPCFVGMSSLLLASAALADDADDIQVLIPHAAGMARADFEKLAKAPKAPKAGDVKEKSLTLMLFTAVPKDDERAKQRFHYLTASAPKPAQLADEMYRSTIVAGARAVLLPITVIHADRITKLTCDVKGDTATGVVSFEAPKLYAGQADYVARKRDGVWQIEEFALPEYDIRIKLADDGKWREKK
jgi:hypothetical protein